MFVFVSYYRMCSGFIFLFFYPTLTVDALVLSFVPPFAITEGGSRDISIYVNAPADGIGVALTLSLTSSLISAGKF